MSERPEPNERVGMKDSPYLHDKSDAEQYRRCREVSVYTQKIVPVKEKGFIPSEVTEMIQKLRKQKFSKDIVTLRNEAIKRCSRTF